MATTSRKLLSFNLLSDGIAKDLLRAMPNLTAKSASAMGHDLARAVLRPIFDSGEVPTHFDVDGKFVTELAQVCREALSGV